MSVSWHLKCNYEYMEETVEVIEIFAPTENPEDSVAYHWENQQSLERVALIVGGRIVFLKEGYLLEKRHFPKLEADNLII